MHSGRISLKPDKRWHCGCWIKYTKEGNQLDRVNGGCVSRFVRLPLFLLSTRHEKAPGVCGTADDIDIINRVIVIGNTS
jgi:hypothetical protein